MTVSGSPRAITLGVYPSSRGFGWAAFENPFSVADFGVFTQLRRKNEACLERIAALIARHEPEAVILEAFDGHESRRSRRIRLLSRAIQSLATDRGHEVAIYSRRDVRSTFADVAASTRDEIASAVARSVPALGMKLPPPRRQYDSEDKRLAMFNAAALVLTHYRNGATAFLDDLRDAA